MADTIKSANELKLEGYFADGDTRTITLSNPKANLTAADIKTVETTTKTTQPIIGDKGGAEFVRFKRARVIEQQKVYLEL